VSAPECPEPDGLISVAIDRNFLVLSLRCPPAVLAREG
jgi:hypothetical protein